MLKLTIAKTRQHRSTPSGRWRARFAVARVLMSRAANRFFLGGLAGALPERLIGTVEQMAHLSAVGRRLTARIRVTHAHIETYSFPPSFPTEFRREHAFDARWISRMTDVCVSTRSGVAWLKDGWVLEESVGSLRRLIGWGNNIVDLLQPVHPLEESGTTLCCASTGFYHWLFEVVPTLLFCLQERLVSVILIPNENVPYIESTMLLLKAEHPHLRIVRKEAPQEVPDLLVPQLESTGGFVHPADIAMLRTILLPLAAARTVSHSLQSVYVSRRRSPKRRLSNEEDLERELQRRGIEVIFTEELSLIDQIRLFAEAKLIVAPHGAGLSNLVWCSKGTKVIEIFPSETFNDCYARLAVQLGLEYAYVTAHPDLSSSGVIPVAAVLDHIAATDVGSE